MGEGTEAKVVVLGNTNVGKTSISVRYCQDMFYDQAQPTVGGSFLSKTLNIQTRKIKLQIWDTAGQERFRSLAPMYYRGANAAVIVYDITDSETLNTAKDWVKELSRVTDNDIVITIVGNKIDLQEQRSVTKKEALEYANSIRASYCEVSAKTGEGINELFLSLSKKLLEEMVSAQPIAPNFSLEKIDAPFTKDKQELASPGCC